MLKNLREELKGCELSFFLRKDLEHVYSMAGIHVSFIIGKALESNTALLSHLYTEMLKRTVVVKNETHYVPMT
jgi:hypothetical protein